jgi:hypothetical protein
MKQLSHHFSSAYLALMLGLGIYPIQTNQKVNHDWERPFPSLTEQIKKSRPASRDAGNQDSSFSGKPLLINKTFGDFK